MTDSTQKCICAKSPFGGIMVTSMEELCEDLLGYYCSNGICNGERIR